MSESTQVWLGVFGGVAVMSVFSVLFGYLFRNKGYPFAAGFAASFLLSPIGAVVVLALLPDRALSRVSDEFRLQVEMEKLRLEGSASAGDR